MRRNGSVCEATLPQSTGNKNIDCMTNVGTRQEIS